MNRINIQTIGGRFGRFNSQLVLILIALVGLQYSAQAAVTLVTTYRGEAESQVYAMAVGGKRSIDDSNFVLIGGAFTTVNRIINQKYIAQFTWDGYVALNEFDADTNTYTGPNGTILAIAWQPDGKVLISGWFLSINGQPRSGISRLNANGSLDTSFNPTVNNDVRAISLQPDGKILIGGVFSFISGVARGRIARLNADGSLDTSFHPGSGADDGGVQTIAQQADGKVLIGGNFTTINGIARVRVARLNTNGSLDASFTPPSTGPNNDVLAMAQQADGKVLIGGYFTSVNGTQRKRIARLNADGSFDTSFGSRFANRGLDGAVLSISPQTDGKVLIGGQFTTVDNTARRGIARLNANGTRDTSFDPGVGPNDTVYTLTRYDNGKVLIGGSFTTFNGTDRHRIALLSLGEAPLQDLSASPDGHAVAWVRGGISPVLQWVKFEISNRPTGKWKYLGAGKRTSDGWELDGLNLPYERTKYIRARGYFSSGIYNGSGSITESIREIYLEKPNDDSICFPVKAAVEKLTVICL